ncbi:hypothetical protein ACNKHK_00470 [Shigella flexneri]
MPFEFGQSFLACMNAYQYSIKPSSPVHTHDDLGLGVGNALAAVPAVHVRWRRDEPYWRTRG